MASDPQSTKSKDFVDKNRVREEEVHAHFSRRIRFW